MDDLGSSPHQTICWCPDLKLPASSTMGREFVLSVSYLIFTISLQKPEQDTCPGGADVQLGLDEEGRLEDIESARTWEGL
jgi:hypothetical protein